MIQHGDTGDCAVQVNAGDHGDGALGAAHSALDHIALVAGLIDGVHLAVGAGVLHLGIIVGGQNSLHGGVALFGGDRLDPIGGDAVDEAQSQGHDGADGEKDQRELDDLIVHFAASFSAFTGLT